MMRAILIAGLTLGVSCSRNDGSSIRVDVASIFQHALTTQTPLDRVSLRVWSPEGSVLFEETVDATQPEIVVIVPAGPRRTFQITGWALAGDPQELLPHYYGEVEQHLAARETVDLLIPVFPAGLLRGEIDAVDQSNVPPSAVAALIPSQTVDGQPERFLTRQSNGRFDRALPLGTYHAEIEYERDGRRYTRIGQVATVEVFKGQTSTLSIAVAPTDFCDPAQNITPDADGDGDRCDVDCNDADPDLNLDDNDGDGASSCAGDCDDSDPTLNTNDQDGDGRSTCTGDCDDSSAACTTDCTTDSDNDGEADCLDACPRDADNDADDDNLCADADNCPRDANAGQEDADNDGVGDVCDQCPGHPDGDDTDNDGVPNGCDTCAAGPDGQDADADGVPDACDVCPGFDDTVDTDSDATPDGCDPDDDNDGALDAADPAPLLASQCGDSDTDGCDDCVIGVDGFGPLADATPANDGTDTDSDGRCDLGDPDDDNDTVPDAADNDPLDPTVCQDVDADSCDDCALGSGPAPNADGPDGDSDGTCDVSDTCTDADGDGFGTGTLGNSSCAQSPNDVNDADPNQCTDFDGDTCDDCTNGGYAPSNDGLDSDADGLCDLGDPDDDNDGILDDGDGSNTIGDNPCTGGNATSCDDNCILVANATQADGNSNGVGDACEGDSDGDGVPDGSDNCPTVPNAPQTNTDGDTEGDACDADDDNDGVVDGSDGDTLDPMVCADADSDTCDDCAIGVDGFGPLPDNTPGNDGTDTDSDGACDAGDTDDDNDGVVDGTDGDPLDPTLCADSDSDSCDDCAVGVDGFGPLPDNTPANDGTDTDSDGLCDVGDPCTDADGDNIGNGANSNSGCANPNNDSNDALNTVCLDTDGDSCDDCSNTTFDPANDGTDTDSDGACDVGDPDDDNDTVADGSDIDPLDAFACLDSDSDTCDDCSVTGGPPSTTNDGLDTDSDGDCNAGDPDDDNDTVLDGVDLNPLNPNICADSDADTCDDCSVSGGPPSTTNDGPDGDGDGICDAGDTCNDSDGDGVGTGLNANSGCATATNDANDSDNQICADTDSDTCDDCYVALSFDPSDDGHDTDSDGLCDMGDPDDDNDGTNDSNDDIPFDPGICEDADGDGCDDCVNSVDGFGPLPDATPNDDGADLDSDGLCNKGDADIDNDTVTNENDNCPRVANLTQLDTDMDGFGDACDCDAMASSGTTDCTSDVDGDSVFDYLDLNLDENGNNLGIDLSHQIIGEGHIPVGACTTNGTTPCVFGDATPTGQDCTEDIDSDATNDCVDNCIDDDGDGAGYDGPSNWKANVQLEDQSTGLRGHPDIIGQGSDLFVIWEDDRGSTGHDLYYADSSNSGQTWSTARSLFASRADEQIQPQIARRNSNGHLYIVWSDKVDTTTHRIYASSSTNGGASWSTPVQVSDATSNDAFHPSLSVDQTSGTLYVAWQRVNGGGNGDIFVDYSTNGGSSWQTDRLVAGGPADQIEPTLSASGGGTLVLAWSDDNAGNYDIVSVASFNNGTNWTPPFRVNSDTSNQDQREPSIIRDGTGRWHLTWTDHRFGDPDIFYSQSKTGTLWYYDHLAFGGGGNQTEPDIAVTSTGIIHIAFTIQDATLDVKAISSRNGEHWSSAVQVNDLDTNNQTQPSITGAGGPDVFAVWVDERQASPQLWTSTRAPGCDEGYDCDELNANCYRYCLDEDSDGYCMPEDCDDFDPAVHAGATETCDIKDNNCNKVVDEGVGTVLLFENMETGAPGWTTAPVTSTQNDWALVTNSKNGPYLNTAFPGGTMYGTDGNNTTNNESEDSALTSPVINVAGKSGVGIQFDTYSFNPNGCVSGTDREMVEISVDGGPWMPAIPCPADEIEGPPYNGDLHNAGFPFTTGGANTIRVRFHFDTVDSVGNGIDDGWYLDNVRVHTCE